MNPANPSSVDATPEQVERPIRVQLRRTKGWRMPENTVKVSRPGKFGNPFAIGTQVCSGSGLDYKQVGIVDRAGAVAAFREMLTLTIRAYPSDEEISAKLRGKNLACFCPLDQPCHADVLLELANQELHP